MEELPFEAELTQAANPGGKNVLAIRITNPFGRFDWVDGLNAQWGAVKLYRSHGFGGLDRGMTISARSESTCIEDLWVLNTADTKRPSKSPQRARSQSNGRRTSITHRKTYIDSVIKKRQELKS